METIWSEIHYPQNIGIDPILDTILGPETKDKTKQIAFLKTTDLNNTI